MTSLLYSWPGGSLEATIRLVVTVVVVYGLVMWLSAIIWVYRDVKNRTSDSISQAVAILLVALLNVPGLIVYLVIRPHTHVADSYERTIESEAILHELQLTATSCQTCRRPIDDDFNICPSCRTVLREPCRSCGRSVRTSWVACPYCAADRAPSRALPSNTQATTTAPLLPPRRVPLNPTDSGAATQAPPPRPVSPGQG